MYIKYLIPDIITDGGIAMIEMGRMVVWYTVRAVLPSRVWVAEAHAPLETGESWFESSKTLTPHYSPGHVCDDVEGTQDSRGWLKCVPAADTYG